jgi:S-adenosylmethionine hydrolase
MPGLVTLLTDFGTRDAFVGIMKGVMVSIDPALRFIDLTHDVPAQAVHIGALVLRSAVGYFPDGTVHLAVVDPGVGTARAPIAVRTDRALLVGPDNGLLAPAVAALGGARAVHVIENAALARQPISRTFHGRDVFAPAAAHLAGGEPIASRGAPRPALIPLALPTPVVAADAVRGAVVYVDRFGNLLTNIDRQAILAFRPLPLSVRVAEMITVPLRDTYGDVAPGQLVALWSSWDTIEIAVRDGSAAAHLGVDRGATVTVIGG